MSCRCLWTVWGRWVVGVSRTFRRMALDAVMCVTRHQSERCRRGATQRHVAAALVHASVLRDSCSSQRGGFLCARLCATHLQLLASWRFPLCLPLSGLQVCQSTVGARGVKGPATLQPPELF